jgi:hypothetical protein
MWLACRGVAWCWQHFCQAHVKPDGQSHDTTQGDMPRTHREASITRSVQVAPHLERVWCGTGPDSCRDHPAEGVPDRANGSRPGGSRLIRAGVITRIRHGAFPVLEPATPLRVCARSELHRSPTPTTKPSVFPASRIGRPSPHCPSCRLPVDSRVRRERRRLPSRP